MDLEYYTKLSNISLNGEKISQSAALEILTSDNINILKLLDAAYDVRQHFVGNSVTIHIINNTQNGHCPEDCHYCAQAKTSDTAIKEYPLKSDEEILAEAENAYKKGAHRYCMVFAGRGPSDRRVGKLAELIKKIKEAYPIEICVSAGLIDDKKAQQLKDAGLDRLNHNLNTSKNHYPTICTSHTFEDRLQTLQAARKAGIQLCSGMIAGMGESVNDIVDVAYQLRNMKVESIPVNFLIPIKGTKLDKPSQLTPNYCLRILCLFRFLNPRSEIRIAAGREMHLRSMEVMALYPANSLFLDGYLNTRGSNRRQTLQMIQDAGFDIQSEHSLNDLLKHEDQRNKEINKSDDITKTILKDLTDLRPSLINSSKK